jgi:thiol-disulfide isomerase/thioredoxin
MKKIVFLVLLCINYIPMMAQNTNPSNDSLMVGKTDISLLETKYLWFKVGYEKYNPIVSTTENIKTKFQNCELIVFGGTWCEDTQKLLPQFYKVLHLAGIDKNKVTLYLLDKEKHGPEQMETTYHIANIPTFILKNNGIEVGRITEHVTQSIEQDIVELLIQKK